MVLLVIDTQKGITDERLYEFEKVTKNIKELIDLARAARLDEPRPQHRAARRRARQKIDEGRQIAGAQKERRQQVLSLGAQESPDHHQSCRAQVHDDITGLCHRGKQQKQRKQQIILRIYIIPWSRLESALLQSICL